MASSLSNLANNLFVGVHSIKWKSGHDDEKCGTCGIKYKYCNFLIEYIDFKSDLIEYKCLCCTKTNNISLMKKRNDFLIHTNFLTTTIISLFYCCGKMLILMNVVGKSSVKHHYLKKIFTDT